MFIPEVNFRYSFVYDQRYREAYRRILGPRKIKEYPSSRRITNYAKRLEKKWRSLEKKILTELSRVTGLPWQAREIPCYIVGRCRAFSDPLTISAYPRLTQAIDVLSHELIHQLLLQNESRLGEFRRWL